MDSVKNRRKNSAMKRKYHDNPEPQEEYNKRKYNKENSESTKISGKKTQGKQDVFNKVERFHQQMRRGPYYI